MVKRLTCLLLLALMLPFPWTAASAQVASEDKLYRVAAWSFYQQQPTQALEVLQLGPKQASRSRLLEAGLYLQLNMPQQAAGILDLDARADTRTHWVPHSFEHLPGVETCSLPL